MNLLSLFFSSFVSHFFLTIPRLSAQKRKKGKNWARRDSNTQPSDLESDALPLRHRPHIYQKIPTTLGIPRRSPIQVLTRLDAAWLRWSDENRYIQRDMVVGNSKDLRSEFWFRNGHILGSIVVSISACHAEDRGSIPRRGGFFSNFWKEKNEICVGFCILISFKQLPW